MYTPNELENLKKVLFGNQLQASVINDAVVSVVSQYLADHSENVNLDTEGSTAVSLCDVLNLLLAEGGTLTRDDETFIRLVAGDTSYYNIMSGEPSICDVTQPNPESPKRFIRVHLIGADNQEAESMPASPTKLRLEDVLPASKDVSLTAQADMLYEQIAPIIPETIRSEVTDKYAQALLVAKAYYSF